MTTNGMTVHTKATGWVWQADHQSKAGMVMVPVRGSGKFWVSVDQPETAVSFAAADPAALMGLAEVFGNDWCRAVLRAAGPAGSSSDPGWAPPALPDSWTRLAVIRGLQQWTPFEVSESVLAVDEALAWQEVGMIGHARQMIRLVAPTVIRLHAALYQGLLPPAAAEMTTAACELALEALPDTDPTRMALQRELGWVTERTTITDVDLDRALTQWHGAGAREADYALALGVGTSQQLMVAVRVDPLAVEPRMIRWSGPNHPLVTVTGAPPSLRVEVELAPGVDAIDVAAMQVVITDRRSGAVVARKALEMIEVATSGEDGLLASWAGPRAAATVEVSEVTGSLLVGVESAGRTQRCDPFLSLLAAAEHHEIAFWAAQRATAVHHLGLKANAAAAAQHLREAQRALVDAEAVAGTDPDFLAAVAEVRDRLERATTDPPPENGPRRLSLAELALGFVLEEVTDLVDIDDGDGLA